MLDNMTDLVIMAVLLSGFGLPKDIIYYRMIPGTALGVMLGDLVFTWMAIRLARKTGQNDVCAMPLGLDTPSTFLFCLSILGPAFLAAKSAGLDSNQAGMVAWEIGMAVLVVCGVVKVGLSFAGNFVRKAVPRAGLLGSIAGIALLLIAFLPAIHIWQTSVVGMLSLGVILVAIVGRRALPGGMPAAFAAVLLGSVAYYVLGAFGVYDGGSLTQAISSVELRIALPWPTLGFVAGIKGALPYLALAIPWAVATVVGGIDCTESAAAVGDDYDTKDVLLTEGIATVVAGLCGGVIQSTPYIGHPAYKEMGGRAAYTLATALFIGLGGIIGFLPFFLELLPEAAVAPILVFIGLEITSQAFNATPKKHASAIAIAFIPSIAYLLTIEVNQALFSAGTSVAALTGMFKGTWETVEIMANGFIVTAMIWGGGTAFIIDKDYGRAAVSFLAGAGCVMVGIIHSPLAGGQLFWPWQLSIQETGVVLTNAGAYATLAGLVWMFNWIGNREAQPESSL
jgi:AGZA family xanthine/uracil permease-like MFS transporter